MKKSLVVVLCILMLVIGATASNTVNAVLGTDIRVALNDDFLELKDAEGKPVVPLLYNGTTYLPVRAIADNLGLNVDWDNENKVVVLETPDFKEKYETPVEKWDNVENLFKVNINGIYIKDKSVVIDYSYQNLNLKENLNLKIDSVLDNESVIMEQTYEHVTKISKPVPKGGIFKHAEAEFKFNKKDVPRSIKVIFKAKDNNNRIKSLDIELELMP